MSAVLFDGKADARSLNDSPINTGVFIVQPCLFPTLNVAREPRLFETVKFGLKWRLQVSKLKASAVLKSRLRLAAGWIRDQVHQKGPVNCCGLPRGLFENQLTGDWPLTFEKKPTFNNENISKFSCSFFPSPHILSFVPGLLFLSQHYLC